MNDSGTGLRERKKRQTRRQLADAALRLFDERGYPATTVADIAAAAGVSTRTFFAYFPSKEDALFADTDERIELMHDLLADLPAGTAPIGAFHAVIDRIFAAAADDLVGARQGPRLRLIFEHPDLQGCALRRLLAAEQAIAGDLLVAFEGRLDEAEALTVTGAAMGAMVAVAMRGMRRGDDATRMRADLHRAITAIEEGLAGVGGRA
jgi:AcrR family transcriptional regulator